MESVSCKELVELILKYWDVNHVENSGIHLFDKITSLKGYIPNDKTKLMLISYWTSNKYRIRDLVWNVLDRTNEVISPRSFLPYDWMTSRDLHELILRSKLYTKSMKNGLVPCPMYYTNQRVKYVMARFGDYKVWSYNFGSVDTHLAAMLKDGGARFICSGQANAMLSKLLPPCLELLEEKRFVALYRRRETWFVLCADVTTKKASLLLPEWASKSEPKLALSHFIGDDHIRWVVRGFTFNEINDLVVLKFVRKILNLKICLNPVSLQATVIKNSDDMTMICLLCGEQLENRESPVVCCSCLRGVHSHCYYKEMYLPHFKLCELCEAWIDMMSK